MIPIASSGPIRIRKLKRKSSGSWMNSGQLPPNQLAKPCQSQPGVPRNVGSSPGAAVSSRTIQTIRITTTR
jgi:hypothetical protein